MITHGVKFCNRKTSRVSVFGFRKFFGGGFLVWTLGWKCENSDGRRVYKGRSRANPRAHWPSQVPDENFEIYKEKPTNSTRFSHGRGRHGLQGTLLHAFPIESQNHYEVMVKMKSAQASLYTLWPRDLTKAPRWLAKSTGSFLTRPVRETNRLKLILRDGENAQPRQLCVLAH